MHNADFPLLIKHADSLIQIYKYGRLILLAFMEKKKHYKMILMTKYQNDNDFKKYFTKYK